MDGLNVFFSKPFQDSSTKSKFQGLEKLVSLYWFKKGLAPTEYPLIKLCIFLWEMK